MKSNQTAPTVFRGFGDAHIFPNLNETVIFVMEEQVGRVAKRDKQIQLSKAAVLVVGGWFDAEDLSDPHKVFHAIATQSPTTSNHIVIGPWVHGGWSVSDGEHIGAVHFGSTLATTSAKYQYQFPFFEHYLKDAPDPNLANATMFETGTNVWRSYSAWQLLARSRA